MLLNITQVTESHPEFIKIKIVSEQAMTNVKYEIRSMCIKIQVCVAAFYGQ